MTKKALRRDPHLDLLIFASAIAVGLNRALTKDLPAKCFLDFYDTKNPGFQKIQHRSDTKQEVVDKVYKAANGNMVVRERIKC